MPTKEDSEDKEKEKMKKKKQRKLLKQYPMYEKLNKNDIYIFFSIGNHFLVATNKNGEGIKLKWLRIPK